MRNAELGKYMTVEDLTKALSNLKGDMRLICNEVKNIAVYSTDNEFVGYIDFLDGQYHSDV